MPRKPVASKAVRREAPAAAPVIIFPRITTDSAATIVVQPDQNVFAQGQPCDAVYYLRAGTAKAHMLSKTGQEAIVILLGPGDFFGESAMLDGARRIATVTAMTECTIDRIEPAEVRRRLGSDPAFSKLFLEFLVERNRRYLADLTDHHFHSIEMRLARALLRMAKNDGNGKLKVETPRLSQETLAGMIGTTRPRVNMFLNKFRRLGMIEYSGKYADKFIVHKSLATILDHA